MEKREIVLDIDETKGNADNVHLHVHKLYINRELMLHFREKEALYILMEIHRLLSRTTCLRLTLKDCNVWEMHFPLALLFREKPKEISESFPRPGRYFRRNSRHDRAGN